jgi:hypothetical protein
VTRYFSSVESRWKGEATLPTMAGGLTKLDEINSGGIDWKSIFGSPYNDICGFKTYGGMAAWLPNGTAYCSRTLHKPSVNVEWGYQQSLGDSARAAAFSAQFANNKRVGIAGDFYWNAGYQSGGYDVGTATTSPLTFKQVLANAPSPEGGSARPLSSFTLGPTTAHSGCSVMLLSARVSGSTPAEVAAEVVSSHPGHTCNAFVERSATAKTQWRVASARVVLPSASSLTGWANTGLVYDGPGYKARACVQAAGSRILACTSAVSLAKGKGTVTSPAFPAAYIRKTAFVYRTISIRLAGFCLGFLASRTTKKTGASVLGRLVSGGDPCTAWFQTTANGGKTWTTMSPVVSYRAPNSRTQALAFTARYTDNPGHLARLCVEDTLNKQQKCSGGW